MGRNLKINRDFVLFAVGALVGSTATWLYLKDEYERSLIPRQKTTLQL